MDIKGAALTCFDLNMHTAAVQMHNVFDYGKPKTRASKGGAFLAPELCPFLTGIIHVHLVIRIILVLLCLVVAFPV